jgi:TRAP-type mannitol/chloroaromatic compound transport system permease small subunit
MNNLWGIFVGYFVLAIMVIIVYETVSRYVFNSPTIWANVIAQLIFGGLIVMGGAYTLLHGGHIRMTIVYERLPGDRVRAIVDVVTSGLFFLFCATILYVSIPACWEATLLNKKVYSTLFPVVRWPTLWCLPVAAVLLTIQGLIKFGRDLNIALHGRR